MTPQSQWTPAAICKLLTMSRLTIEQLAHEVGVTSTTAWRWKNGRSTPSPLARGKLSALAREIGMPCPR